MSQETINLISTVGFPIFACFALYVLNEKQSNRFLDEISKLRDVINNNTIIIQRFVDGLNKNND